MIGGPAAEPAWLVVNLDVLVRMPAEREIFVPAFWYGSLGGSIQIESHRRHSW